jgi:hypothetical protein
VFLTNKIMRKNNLVMAIIFIVINLLPFIFGICFFFLLIPIPGIILYFYYWRMLSKQTTLAEIRNTWLATAIYNLVLILIFSSEDGARALEIKMPEQGWILAYQAAAFTAGALMAYLNHNFIQANEKSELYDFENEQDTQTIENI